MEKTCELCGKPEDECVCCPECGHECPLDAGEDYCPVCSPKEAQSRIPVKKSL